MARSKLADAEKLEIVRFYRETAKTAPKLAEEFGVSVSTIVRILKTVIEDQEYAILSLSKRRGEPTDVAAEATLSFFEPLVETEVVAVAIPVEPEVAPSALDDSVVPVVSEVTIMPESAASVILESETSETIEPTIDASPAAFFVPPPVVKPALEVLPYERMELPEICYIVVDRWAELIARPLREFNFLENIPAQEQEAIALPVFDNHRWAKRYSNRFQRILRVETRLLDITKPYLMQRGITRLLVGRQVFALDLTSGPIHVIASDASTTPLGLEPGETLEDFDAENEFTDEGDGEINNNAFTALEDEGDDYGDGDSF
jgi:hypothetical protein